MNSDAPETIYIPAMLPAGESEYILATRKPEYHSGRPLTVAYRRADLVDAEIERLLARLSSDVGGCGNHCEACARRDDEIERLRAEAKRYRDCLIWVQHRISMAKIWGGMGWHWNPLHPAHYKPAIERIDAVLAGGNEQETSNE